MTGRPFAAQWTLHNLRLLQTRRLTAGRTALIAHHHRMVNCQSGTTTVRHTDAIFGPTFVAAHRRVVGVENAQLTVEGKMEA